MRIGSRHFIMFISLLVLWSCGDQQGHERERKQEDPGKSLEKVNRYLVKSEKEDIENYIRRHGWQMEETGSGLRYMIYEKGTGVRADRGKIAVLEYKVWLINGEQVYSSDEDGPKIFQIGKGGVESGLEEGILLLHAGDKARFIMPSHLAYGLLGDEKKIPPRTAIVYDIELKELK